MSGVGLRTKLVVALAVLAALASATIGWFSYRATADRLQAEVDRSLDLGAREVRLRIERGGSTGFRPPLIGREGDGGRRGRPDAVFDLVVAQLLARDGAVLAVSRAGELPVDAVDVAVADRSGPPEVRRSLSIDGEPYRMLTERVDGGPYGAVQMARSLAENQRLLDALRNRILWAVVVVVTAAAVLGWVVARQVTRRLVHLTDAAEQVARTGRLDVAVPTDGTDETGRLGAAFASMLGALRRSRDEQQRLVQDAGHELRTPITSLRTNISVLRRADRLTPTQLQELLDDLDGETRELSVLVNELVELATDRREDEPVEPVALAAVAERVADRARRRTGRVVTVAADASVVLGRVGGLERAVQNLVDNAVKFDPDGTAPVEVTVVAGTVTVLDRGPGIADADLPHVFERFYRSIEARGRPGSGLGLSIVQTVAESHGGTVFARPRPGGGSAIGFTVPTVTPR